MAPRRRLDVLLFSVAGLILAGAPARAATGVERPSVLLVTIDALRVDRLGCYGHGGGLTPRIDGLAAGGVRIERFYANGPWTIPSIRALLTSLPSSAHSDDPADEGVRRGRTLAETFREAGYATGAVVANPHLSPALGYDAGFDDFANLSLPADGAPGAGGGEESRGWLDAILGRVRRRTPEGRAHNPIDDTGDFVTARAIRWLAEHPERPFFLWVHYLDPHFPYHPPESFPLAVEASFPERRDLLYLTLFSVWRNASLFSGDYRDYLARMYSNEVAFVDAEVGRLLDGLAEEGAAERTAVVLTADHGEELWDHGGFEHGHGLYEEVVRIPLVVRAPGRLPAGRVTAGPGQMLDLAPTLLEIAGIEPLAEFRGRSFLAALAAPDGSGGPDRRAPEGDPRPIFVEGTRYGPRRWGLVEGRTKTIVTEGRRIPEIYLLDEDPGEVRDRALERPGEAGRAAREIEAWREGNAALRATLPERSPASPPAGVSMEADERLRSLGYGW